jgi:hypothetical protein
MKHECASDIEFTYKVFGPRIQKPTAPQAVDSPSPYNLPKGYNESSGPGFEYLDARTATRMADAGVPVSKDGFLTRTPSRLPESKESEQATRKHILDTIGKQLRRPA